MVPIKILPCCSGNVALKFYGPKTQKNWKCTLFMNIGHISRVPREKHDDDENNNNNSNDNINNT